MEHSSIYLQLINFLSPEISTKKSIIYPTTKFADLSSLFFQDPSHPLSRQTPTLASRVTGCQRPQKTEIPPAVFTRFITYRVNAEWLPVLRKLVPLIYLVRAGSYRPDNGRVIITRCPSSRESQRLSRKRRIVSAIPSANVTSRYRLSFLTTSSRIVRYVISDNARDPRDPPSSFLKSF